MRNDKSRDEPTIRNLAAHAPSKSDPEAEPLFSGWVDYAGWLSDDLLLIIGWFDVGEANAPEISLFSGDRSVPLETRCISYHRSNPPNAAPNVGKVITARFPRPEDAREPLGSVLVRTDAATLALGPLDLTQAVTDLTAMVRSCRAGWDAETRNEVMDFVALIQREHGTTNGLRLSKSLFTVREELRERLRHCAIAQDEPQGLHIDTLLAIDEKSFYVKGWARDEEAEITNLAVVSPEGARTEILDGIFRYPRPDVEQFYGATSSEQLLAETGFIAYFEIEAPSRLPSGWVVEMRDAAGTAVEAAAPRVVRDSVTVRDMVLGDLLHERLPGERLMAEQVFPAVSRIQDRLHEGVKVKDVIRYGKANESPDVSIVVPLYQRVDLLEQQLAQFVHDPEIHQAELIYVLDSPELADGLGTTASQLFQLYRLPFSVVTLERNAGFSAVNNVGASLARGRLLLLLNSDVLPDKPGWLGKMGEFYDSTPSIGALGPKLLYEDDSLQHAGIYFSPLAGSPVWENRHYFKGLQRHLPVASVTRPVPALTGACLMIDSELYERFGGLRGLYVQGDYEDSDLCLRLHEAGYENWYLPDIELYHLEGQSYALASRQLNGRYNTWLHTRLWRERIEKVMDQYSVLATEEGTASNNRRQQARKTSAIAGPPVGEQDAAVKKSRPRPNKRSKRQAGPKRQDGK